MIKRLLFVISNSSISGAEKQLLLLLKNLNKTKYNFEVCCLDQSGSFTDAVSELGLTVHVSGRSKKYDIARLIFLIKLINKNDYSCLISYCYSANQYTRMASFITGKPNIACERGHDYTSKSIENFLIKVLSPISDLILFNSKIQMASYKDHVKYFQPKTKCIYNGISANDIGHKESDKICKKYDIKKDNKIIGTVGNFSEHKNFMMFINVCENIFNIHNNVHFVAIGQGPDMAKYKDYISRSQLKNVFTFTGYVSPVYNYLSQLDVFLLTSKWEGMPNVVMEAMLNRVPVISTNVDGSRELIRHGENGFLVDIDDVNSMSDFVVKIINGDVDIYTILNKAKSDVLSNYSLESMIKNYQDVFDLVDGENQQN